MKEPMMPIDAVPWSLGVFFLILLIIGIGQITRPIEPKVIKPSGPGTCDEACCIELIENSDLAFDIKNSRLEIK